MKRAFIVLCLLLAGSYIVSYHSVHANEKSKAARVVEKRQELTTQLSAAWQKVLSTNSPDGNVDIAVYDKATGATAEYTNTIAGTTYDTASVIKLSILEEILLQNQEAGTSGLTDEQLANATPMIENSDNDSATNLWYVIGGSSAINGFFQRIGATNSYAAGDWGLTQTTAEDQLKVINQIAYPTLLLPTSTAAATDLMNNIESDQLWGVTGGVPTGVSVQLKDGWLENSGWDVNSVGHVHGVGADYTIAVLTSGNSTERDGITTIEALSAVTWRTLSGAKA